MTLPGGDWATGAGSSLAALCFLQSTSASSDPGFAGQWFQLWSRVLRFYTDPALAQVPTNEMHTNLEGRVCSYPHVTDKETGTERLNNLPEIMQQVAGQDLAPEGLVPVSVSQHCCVFGLDNSGGRGLSCALQDI